MKSIDDLRTKPKDEWNVLQGARGALSGAQEYVLFGRNEPALHHYHNTYREALGLPPLETA